MKIFRMLLIIPSEYGWASGLPDSRKGKANSISLSRSGIGSHSLHARVASLYEFGSCA